MHVSLSLSDVIIHLHGYISLLLQSARRGSRVLHRRLDSSCHTSMQVKKYDSFYNAIILKVPVLIKCGITQFLIAGSCDTFLPISWNTTTVIKTLPILLFLISTLQVFTTKEQSDLNLCLQAALEPMPRNLTQRVSPLSQISIVVWSRHYTLCPGQDHNRGLEVMPRPRVFLAARKLQHSSRTSSWSSITTGRAV